MGVVQGQPLAAAGGDQPATGAAQGQRRVTRQAVGIDVDPPWLQACRRQLRETFA